MLNNLHIEQAWKGPKHCSAQIATTPIQVPFMGGSPLHLLVRNPPPSPWQLPLEKSLGHSRCIANNNSKLEGAPHLVCIILSFFFCIYSPSTRYLTLAPPHSSVDGSPLARGRRLGAPGAAWCGSRLRALRGAGGLRQPPPGASEARPSRLARFWRKAPLDGEVNQGKQIYGAAFWRWRGFSERSKDLWFLAAFWRWVGSLWTENNPSMDLIQIRKVVGKPRERWPVWFPKMGTAFWYPRSIDLSSRQPRERSMCACSLSGYPRCLWF